MPTHLVTGAGAGIGAADGLVRVGDLLDHWRISSTDNRTIDEYGLLVRGLIRESGFDTDEIRAAVIASVHSDPGGWRGRYKKTACGVETAWQFSWKRAGRPWYRSWPFRRLELSLCHLAPC